MTMKKTALLIAGCALMTASTAEAKNIVVFNGCIVQKVMKGALCTYVGNFNITGATPAPDPFKGLGISGNGMRAGPKTVCGGIRLSNVKWQYNKMKCRPPIGVRREG